MKKICVCLLAIWLLICCTGCSVAAGLLETVKPTATPAPAATHTPEPSAEPTAEPTPVPAPSPEELLAVFTERIELLNSCFSELYGAQLDTSVVYNRVYTSEEAMIAGEAPIDVIPAEENTTVTDPTWASLYPVTNFSTNAEVRAYLESCFAPDVVDGLFRDSFLEFDGKLYMVYASRGYGGHLFDPAAAQIAELGEDRCVVTTEESWFETPNGTVELTFENRDGTWILTGYTQNAW